MADLTISFLLAPDKSNDDPYGEAMSKTLPNPIPRRYAEADEELFPLFDAFEGGDEGAIDLAIPALVGLPCTYDNGCDAYVGKVVLASRSKIVADMGRLGEMTFQPRASGWMKAGRACGWLHVGVAHAHICREA